MLTPTDLKITVASHVFSHAGACMQIQESMKGGYSTYVSRLSRGSGGMLQNIFELFIPQESFWCNLRLATRLEIIKWPFLD